MTPIQTIPHGFPCMECLPKTLAHSRLSTSKLCEGQKETRLAFGRVCTPFGPPHIACVVRPRIANSSPFFRMLVAQVLDSAQTAVQDNMNTGSSESLENPPEQDTGHEQELVARWTKALRLGVSCFCLWSWHGKRQGRKVLLHTRSTNKTNTAGRCRGFTAAFAGKCPCRAGCPMEPKPMLNQHRRNMTYVLVLFCANTLGSKKGLVGPRQGCRHVRGSLNNAQ